MEGRSTRQTDTKKRQTNNSNLTTVTVMEKVQPKKKQKTQDSNTGKLSNEEEDDPATPIRIGISGDISNQQKISNIKSRILSFTKRQQGEKEEVKVSTKGTSDIHVTSNKTINSVATSNILENVKEESKNDGAMINRPVLGGGHFSMLHTYVRDDLFKRIKILSPHHLESNSLIMQTCLKQVKYNEKINGNKLNFMQACKAEIRKTMCSRRGYVKRQIGLLITDIVKNNEDMFNIDLMQHFYNPDYESNELVISAWCTYVLKFLPLVNKQWRENVSSDKLRNKEFLFHSITISDEAIVRWFIELWVPIIDSRKTLGWSETEKSLGKGPHDTKKNIQRYSILHKDINDQRNNYNTAIRWNEIFWMEVEKKHKNLFKLKERRNYGNIQTNIDIPLPDINDESDFLATYNYTSTLQRDSVSTNSIDICPDYVNSNEMFIFSEPQEI